MLDMVDDWITTTEAVKLSGYSADHLRELIRTGKVEGHKFGIVWQVSKRSLFAYLNAAKQAGDNRWGPKE